MVSNLLIRAVSMTTFFTFVLIKEFQDEYCCEIAIFFLSLTVYCLCNVFMF